MLRTRRCLLLCSLLTAVSIATPVKAGIGMPAPEIAAETWLNSKPQRLADLRGKVTLVEFWTFGCYNCRNVEPHVKQWHQKYGNLGLVVIGVHTPETAYERDVHNVKAAWRYSDTKIIEADFKAPGPDGRSDQNL